MNQLKPSGLAMCGDKPAKRTKQQYLALLLGMPVDWLMASAAQPSPYMTAMDVKLHYLAIRRKSA